MVISNRSYPAGALVFSAGHVVICRLAMGKNLGSIFLVFILVFTCLVSACSQAAECVDYGGVKVCQPVLDFFRDRGGPDVFGYPITVAIPQDTLVLQYFENVVIQYPANDPKEAALRPLGLELSSPTDPELPQSDSDCEYFQRYGHHVCLAFYDFFVQHGGEDTFGQPISHLMMENGTRVQVFENAKFEWINGQQGRIVLASWGRQACLSEQEVCAENVYTNAPAGQEQAPSDDVSQAMDGFVEEYGGTEVFGEKIGSLVYAGSFAFQYFQNACLLWTPGKENPVSLADLGLVEAPAVPRIPPPEVSDQVQFFPETGHSVILAFLDFYRMHGGRDVFGLPLTEYAEEEGQGYQWFEKVRFEWRPDLPDGQRVQLAPLGEMNFYRFDGGLPDLAAAGGSTPESLTPQPAEIDLQVFPEHPLLTLGTRQQVTVLARGPDGQGLQGVEVTLYVQTDTEEKVTVAPPTGVDGLSVVELGEITGTCGQMVQLRAVAGGQNTTAWAQGQFTLWCTPAE